MAPVRTNGCALNFDPITSRDKTEEDVPLQRGSLHIFVWCVAVCVGGGSPAKPGMGGLGAMKR